MELKLVECPAPALASDIDIWTGVVALIQWRASILGPVHLMVLNGDTVTRRSITIDPEESMTALVQAVKDSQPPLDSLATTSPDIAVEWNSSPAFDVPTAPLVVALTPDSGTVSYFWDPEKFDRTYVQNWHDHLDAALRSLADNPDQPLKDLLVITKRERALIDEANDTAHPITDCHYVYDLLARAISLHGDKVAMVGAEGSLTFTELGARVDALTSYLREKGVRSGDAVGLLGDRGLSLIVGMIAVMKAGAAMVPLSRAYPRTRTDEILDDSGASMVLVTNSAYRALLPETMAVIDLGGPDIPTVSDQPVDPADAGDLCAILYTSGTSGVPKGVMVRHSTIVNAAETCRNEWRFGSTDAEPQFAPMTFIAAVNEIAFALAAGGTQSLPSDEIIQDPRGFTMYSIEHQVTHIVTTPDYAQYLGPIPTVRTVVTLGAQCLPHVSEHLSAYEHINVYGLTEAGLALYWRRSPGQPIPANLPIGRPIWNTQAHVLRDGIECGMYMPGELCLSGACVSAGYKNLPELNEQHFVPNPFGEGLMFRTGDLVQWNADGDIEYIGRRDEQVQIHGQRVELGEVEHALLALPGITHCCAVASTDSAGDPSIAAFIVAGLPLDCQALRNRLMTTMVPYMVPARIVQIDEMPRTANGKYDKRALFERLDTIPFDEAGPSAPDGLETVICDTIQEILPGVSVSPTDSFFSLGGDSLTGVRFVNELETRTGIRLPLATVFEHPTPRELTSVLYEQMRKQFSTLQGQHIPSIGGPGLYPASSPQRRLFIVDQLDQEGLAYHIPEVVRLRERVDPTRLQQAVQQLIDRHEVLRTTFSTGADGEVVQQVHDHADATLEVVQVGDVSDQTANEVLTGFVRPFDLGEAPLIRVMLAQGPDDESLLLFDAHHSVLDGTSMTLLVEEFSRLLKGEELPPVGAEYKDYSAWFSNQDSTAANQYWANQFADPPTELDLPTDYPRPPLQTFAGATLTRMISPEVRARVEEIAHRSGATEAMVMMAGWGAVLGRYGRTDDLVIGMPVSGRVHPDTERMLGMFVNTIPLRVRPLADLSFDQLLAQVRDTMATSLTHQAYPLEDILDQVDIPRDLSHNPLFDTVLVFQNFSPVDLDLTGLDAQLVPIDTVAANLDISVYVTPVPQGGYQVVMEYRTDLFTPETIDYMFRHLATFLDRASASPGRRVDEVSLIDEAEQGFLDQVNDIFAPVRDVSVVDLFDEQVASQPDAVAVIVDGQQWTYRELNVQVRRVAARLVAAGVAPGTYVALLLDRSLEMVAAILGVLTAGGAYVPINTDTPLPRMSAILDECHPVAVLVNGSTPQIDHPVIDLADPSEDSLEDSVRPGLDDPAYCIFTSGSTGVPKGVVITHRSLSVFVQDPMLTDLFHRPTRPMFAATSDYSFDMFMTPLFSGVCRGVPMVVATQAESVNQREFAHLVRTSGLTIIQDTPTRIKMLTADAHERDYLSQIELFVVGGEAVPEDLCEMLADNSPAAIQVMYGPTETTVWSAGKPWRPGQPIEIGRPLANEHISITDAGGRLTGVGVPGEICISGAGLAQGYLGDPELTAKKFTRSIHADESDVNAYLGGSPRSEDVERVTPDGTGNSQTRGTDYHTGDLAIWHPDGNLRFLGRIDSQVKVHGVRIETGEVEHAIRGFAGIRDAIVVARPVHDEMTLCAYYVSDTPVDANKLREFVAGRLPRTMLPSYWTQVDELPMNRSAKIDLAALPTPDVTFAEYVSPSTPDEQLVAQAMCTVLGLDRVGAHDDFFALGGDSLRAMQLVNQIETTSGVRLGLHDVFQNPQVDELADLIGDRSGSFEPIVSLGGAGVYPASSPQRRLFVIDQLDREGLAYHSPVMVRIRGGQNPGRDSDPAVSGMTGVDPERLTQVFQELVDRHEVLRTSFIVGDDGGVMQVVRDHLDVGVEVVQADDLSDQATRGIMAGFMRPFDLGEAPLVRMMLVQGPEESLLLFDAHHIILDGMSMTLLVEEFSQLYGDETFHGDGSRGSLSHENRPHGPTGVEFKDYVAWFDAQDSGAASQYWAEQFRQPPAALDLPTDHPRPPLQTFAGARLTRTIPASLRGKVEEVARQSGATEAMVMMTGWASVLSRYGRTDDVVVGMPVSGRVHPDTERMLGMFVNTLPLRLHPHPEQPFGSFLADVRDTMVNSLTYQSYPLEDILDQIDLARDLSRNPLFDTVLAFQNYAKADLDVAGLDARIVDGGMTGEDSGMTHQGARFDLSISITPVKDAYEAEVEYRTDLFDEPTIDYLFRHLITFLDTATASPTTPLGEVSMIDADEQGFLDHLNDTEMALPDQRTIPELFSHVVAMYPDKLAVVCDDQEQTYRELDERVRRIAARLRSLGVDRDDLVGIYANRSLPAIEGILGVIIAGGAYLPLDPAWPESRLKYVTGNAHPKAIIVSDTALPYACGVPVLYLGDPGLTTGEVPVLDVVNQPGDLAYCIYTSGSTGEPKGVLVEHLGVCNLVNVARQYGIGPDDRILAYASLGFDASVAEWAHALLVGGTLVIPTEAEVSDTAWLNAHLAGDITVMTAPPALVPQLDLTHLPRLISAGAQARPIPGFTGAFVNGYGPTEATVVSALWAQPGVDVWPDPVPIGQPRANLTAYIRDPRGGVCGIGVPGELCVSGMGLARGYLGDPELTTEKFIPSPSFCRGQDDTADDRLYCTGDMVVWGYDGNLRFLGRVDGQVKIHGIRIEPGEVEHVIRDYEGITDVVVVARPDHDGELALCAYFVGESVDVDNLREFVAQRLPRTMLPSYWTRLNQLPVNRSGKIDVSALPAPGVHHAEYAEPSTPAERRIAEAMKDVLGVDQVGAHDDFFALGGDSLKAMQLVNQIEVHTGTRLSLRDVFHDPHVDELATLVTSHHEVFDPIVSVGGAGTYPASSQQRRLFVIDQLDPTSLAYHIPAVIRFTDREDPDVSRPAQAFSTIGRLEQVFRQLVDRHEVLRTSFTTDSDGNVVQVVYDHIDTHVGLIQVEDVSDEAARAIMALFIRPFDLGEAPLVRVALVQGPAHESLLLFDAHHIILDGTSMTLLIDEFYQLFRGEELPPVGVESKDYSAWLAGQNTGNAKQYWADLLVDPPAALDLPTDHPRPPLQTFAGATLTRRITSDVREKVEELAHRTGATQAMVMMAAWGAVLGRYGRTDDLVVGLPVSGRVHPDTERMLGMFVNTLPIRLRPHAEESFEQLVEEVRDTMVDCLTYQSYPLEDIIDQIDLPRDMSRNPLFDTVLVFQNFTQPDVDGMGGGDPAFSGMTHPDGMATSGGMMDISNVVVRTGAKFDLSATVTPVPQAGYEVEVEYRTDLFDEPTIDYLFRHLATFLDNATTSPTTALSEVSMIDADEQGFLDHLNDTEIPLPDQRTIPELFSHVVATYPDKVAVVCDGQEWTYRQLDERVRHIAARLRGLGVGRDDLVGLYVPRGLPLIEGFLGIIVSGGAYVGLDTGWPDTRLGYVLGNAHPKAILTNGTPLPVDPGVPILDLNEPDLFTGPAPVLEQVNQPGDLAYCIYTSGSTGEPKGVLIEHLGVCNLVNVAHQFGISTDDRVLQYASIAFDASVVEWAEALLLGGTLVVPTEGEVSDMAWLDAHLVGDVTALTAPPALISHLDVSSLPRLISAGSQARPVHGFTGMYANGYGPTETTVCSTLWVRPDDVWPDPVPIGRPRANAQVYLRDAQGNLCGIGVPGQMYVSGVGLARGYLGDPELTAEKFVRNPFGQGRLYSTGDVAVWGPDGNLRFLGRIDAQMKVHGIRIEPGEIEHAIRDYPGIDDVVVVARPDNDGELTLCAYFTSSSGEVDVDRLRAATSERLPRTMVPSYWTQIGQIPLNRSGKVDVAALPDPQVRSAGYVEPSTPVERQVADAMGDVLGLDRVGAHDTFFALGGDSLKAMQLVNQIEARSGVRLKLQDVFQNPGVEDLAAVISGLTGVFEPIRSVGGAGVYPASSPQRRLFVIDQLDQQGLAYHVPTMLRIRGAMDPARLQQVFQDLVDRHEVLRTSFMIGTDGQVLQQIHDHVDATLQVIQVADVSDRAAQEVFTGFVRPFDLGEAPLVRVMLAQGPADESLLLFDAHHIILDGTSMTQLVEEFSRMYSSDGAETRIAGKYSGEGALARSAEYKDYAAWFATQDMEPARQYWTEAFAELPAELDLPTDYPRPALQTFSGATLTRTIPESIRTQVEEVAHQTGATGAMVWTAAWGAVLGRYARTDDLVVGMPISGRIHPDTEHMLGMFVNTIPVRVHPHTGESFEHYLTEVRDTMVSSLTFQSYPLEDILDQIDLPRDLSRNPLFDTVLVYQNFTQPELDLTGLDAQVVPSEKTGANLDVSVYVTPIPQAGYRVDMEYRTDLFTSETIDYFFRHLETFLDHATRCPDTVVGEISLIDKEEQGFLDTINDTVVELRDVTVVDLFDEQVAAGPDGVAVVCDNQQWTYRDLDARARQIAAELRNTGVARGQYVALLTSRSAEMVAAIMGVLKAGAAYVPLNVDLPPARMDAMVATCHPAAILTFGASVPDSVHVDCPVIDVAVTSPTALDNPGILPAAGSPEPGGPASLDDPAYCIFTSGSTGVPKGVVITHRSLAAFAQEPTLQGLYHSCDQPMFVSTADYSFDMSVTEWFTGLCRGIPVVVATESECVDQHEFARLISSTHATIVQATPTRLRMLTADPDDRGYLATIELFLVGGEGVPEDLLVLLNNSSPAPIWIMYGPTEATVWATTGHWVPDHPVTIGRPLANQRLHVRDISDGECGIGVPGEVCVAGVALARGYLGDPELTAEKFTDNQSGETRLYHTGDLGLWGTDGNLRFLGRIDTQVKVHGVRIETGEVEHVIREYPGITDAVVVAREVHCDTVLCAYYSTDPDCTIEMEDLRSFVAEHLPRTMLPSYWTHMDRLPVNRSGKTDVRALPDPAVHFAQYAAPTTPTELVVADVMKDVLGVDLVGLHDDFFALGGDSLKALQLANQIEAHIGAHLRLQDIFQNPSVSGLAHLVENQNGAFEPIESVGGAGIYPTTSQERQMLDGVDDDSYHVTVVVRMHGHLDPARVGQVFQRLVDRHEALRTAFLPQSDGEILQQVYDHVDAAMEVTQVQDVSDEAARQLLAGFIRPFDLEKPPVFRLMLAEGPDETWLVVIDGHHAILDGMSMTILIEEFSRLYRGEVLPPVNVEYKDYSVWLNAHDTTPAEHFWSTLYADLPPTLDMPYDYPRPPLLSFTDEGVTRTFSTELRTQVNNLARKTGTTEAMVVFAALSAVLSRYAHTEDLVIGVTASGRSHPDTKDMLGVFANGLPLRVRPHLASTFEEYLGEVRDLMVPALAYQDYSFQDVCQLVGPPPDSSRLPLMDVIFSFQNFTQADLDLPGITSELIPSEDTGVGIDLAIFTLPGQNGYVTTIDYRSNLYKRETIEALFNDWEALLTAATRSPEIVLGEIPMSR